MIIGINGINSLRRKEVSKFLQEKYLLKYLDVDKILEMILQKNNYLIEFNKNTWKDNYSLLLKIENGVEEEILKIISHLDSNEHIIIDYSLLSNSFLFNRCDFVINIGSEERDISENTNTTLKIYQINSFTEYIDDSKYHLKLNMQDNWKEKISDFLDYNLFKKTKISVIVPIYNTENYLARCINSIRNQSYKNLEIILIDDGSTDNSLELCNMMAKSDARIKVFHQDNMGLSETRNRGIERATGDYICFVDSDDFIEKGMLENLLRNAEKYNTDISTVRAFIHLRNGKVERFSNDREIICIKEPKDLISCYADGIISIAAWDKLYKASALEGIRFDKNVFQEDADFIFKLCLAGRTFVCDTEEFYHYVKRGEGSLTGLFTEDIFKLAEWGKKAYTDILNSNPCYQDEAEKCLFNSLTHVLKTYMRDLVKEKISVYDYNNQIQNLTGDILNLLFRTRDVKKFADLDNVLEIINELISRNVINKDKLPSIEVPCIGILWNTLNKELMDEAIEMVRQNSEITECLRVDLAEQYQDFINDIYFYNNEFEGIPYFKASALIDKYDSNSIVILNLIVKVSNYIYFNNMKGYMFKEIAELKQLIRQSFKKRIKNYGYDTVFHLTVDDEEYQYTTNVCKKYVKSFRGNQDGKQ